MKKEINYLNLVIMKVQINFMMINIVENKLLILINLKEN